jgi:hypothetical protein
MTDTKTTLDEQIAWLSRFVGNAPQGCNVYAAHTILASLEDYKRIHEAEMPVEPECVTRMRRLKDDQTWDVEWTTLRYIDALKAYAQRKDAEVLDKNRLIMEATKQVSDAMSAVIHQWKDHAESLEKEKAALIAENEALRKDALRLDALESILLSGAEVYAQSNNIRIECGTLYKGITIREVIDALNKEQSHD